MSILYDTYHIQDASGAFDIFFETERLENEFQFNLVDIVNCQLFSNKRINSNKQPLYLRGGSVCDVVYNTTGDKYGSLIWYYALANIQISEKIVNITAEIKNTLQILKKNNILDTFKVDYVTQDSKNDNLLFNLVINNTKYNLIVKYGN
jgi:hypothetical protein